MIELSPQIILDGVGEMLAVSVVQNDGSIQRQTIQQMVLANGTTTPTEVVRQYIVGSTPELYCYSDVSTLLAENTYGFAGSVFPADTPAVYLSVIPADTAVTPELLKTGIYKTIVPASDGTFSGQIKSETNMNVVAWFRKMSDVTINGTESISMMVSIVGNLSGSTGRYIIVDGPESGTYVPRITLTGTCPNEATVYISSYLPGDPMSEAALLRQKVAVITVGTAEQEYNNFSVSFYGIWGGYYVVWTTSDTPYLTVSTLTYTDRVCLSGDTLITMADGSTKRLDAVQPGDYALAGNGSATKVIHVAHGDWNDHHTLYRFADGTVIDEIHDHRFFNVEQGFWQLLDHWNIGDHARRQDGSEVALVSVERVNEPAEMFGLWTESRDYWANGLLSGETAANQALLADATVEQVADMMASLDETAIAQMLKTKGLLP